MRSLLVVLATTTNRSRNRPCYGTTTTEEADPEPETEESPFPRPPSSSSSVSYQRARSTKDDAIGCNSGTEDAPLLRRVLPRSGGDDGAGGIVTPRQTTFVPASSRRMAACWIVAVTAAGAAVYLLGASTKMRQTPPIDRLSGVWQGGGATAPRPTMDDVDLLGLSSNCRLVWEALRQWKPPSPNHQHHNDHHHDHNHDHPHRSSFHGTIVGPHQRHTFANAHRVWNRLDDGMPPPCAVLEPRSATVVAQALLFLEQLHRHRNIPWAIQSGGHNFAGWSSSGASNGIVLSLTHLNDWNLDIEEGPSPHHRDAPTKTTMTTAVATVGPGCTIGDVLARALHRGYGGVVGSAATVGFGGYVLGGGFGYWSRQHGLAIDNVLEMQVVLSNASIVTTSDVENPDLFWALRGAGQSTLGVVTRYKYRLYPSQPKFLQATGYVPHQDAAALLCRAAAAEEGNGDGLPRQCHLELTSDEHGLVLFVACLGETKRDLYEGEVAVRQFLGHTLSRADTKKIHYENVSWHRAAQDEAEQFEGYLSQVWNGFVLPSGDVKRDRQTWEELSKSLWEACRNNPYVMLDVELRGAAIADVAPTATAFPWRNATHNVVVVVYVHHREKHAVNIYEREAARMAHLWERTIAPHLHGTFANYAMASLKDLPAATAASMAWGDNLDRLEGVKAAYDPQNAVHTVLSVPLPPKVESASPTKSPPSDRPTLSPTHVPTSPPTDPPSPAPSEAPTDRLTDRPTTQPSEVPTRLPVALTGSPTALVTGSGSESSSGDGGTGPLPVTSSVPSSALGRR